MARVVNKTQKPIFSKKTDKDSSDMSDVNENDELSDAYEEDVPKRKIKEEKPTKKKGKKKLEKLEIPDIEKYDEEAQREYIQNVVLDRVIKYCQIDDIIKEKQMAHRQEIKSIKESKEQLENYLLDYLDKINEEYIDIRGKGRLIKDVKTVKAPPKMEDIAESLVEGFKKYELYDNDDEIRKVVNDFITNIESKRATKISRTIKRIDENKINEKKENKKKKK